MAIGHSDGANSLSQLSLSEMTRRLGDRFKTVSQWESRPTKSRLPGLEDTGAHKKQLQKLRAPKKEMFSPVRSNLRTQVRHLQNTVLCVNQ